MPAFHLLRKVIFYTCIHLLGAVMAVLAEPLQHRLLTASVSYGGPFLFNALLQPSCLSRFVFENQKPRFLSPGFAFEIFYRCAAVGDGVLSWLFSFSNIYYYLIVVGRLVEGFSNWEFFCILYGVGLTASTCPLGLTEA